MIGASGDSSIDRPGGGAAPWDMIIRSAQFVTSGTHPRHFPCDGRPEIAFAGRSNVGKSSLINCLAQRKGLAHTSRTPGRTQTINFYDINGNLYFVDLPGYGYAKAPEEIKRRWRPMIESYLNGNDRLRGVVVLIDARHDPSRLDHQLLEYLAASGVTLQIVATKIDKLGSNERFRNLAALRRTLADFIASPVIAFSAQTREGREPLLEMIGRWTDWDGERGGVDAIAPLPRLQARE